MNRIKVSAVKYTNSIPFIYGLQNYSLENEIILSLDTPTDCYNKLLSGISSIGLVPVIIKNHSSRIQQISSYGIGSEGDVLSVVLISMIPVKDVKVIYLDYQSRTSAMLTRLLCRDFWNINPEFRIGKPGFEDEEFKEEEARLIIGDRAFPFYNREGMYITDLAGEWSRFTSLPFLFAFWASTQELNPEFAQKFNDALSFGMTHKVRMAKEMSVLPEFRSINLPEYLNQNIIHEITPRMQEGMNLFLHLIRDF
jgi:chorismate dehydratase